MACALQSKKGEWDRSLTKWDRMRGHNVSELRWACGLCGVSSLGRSFWSARGAANDMWVCRSLYAAGRFWMLERPRTLFLHKK
jgi:hypothetical protein